MSSGRSSGTSRSAIGWSATRPARSSPTSRSTWTGSSRATRDSSSGSRESAGLQGLERVRHRGLWLDAVPGLRDPAVLVHQERGSKDAHVPAATVFPFDPGAVRLRDGVILVGEEREAETVLLIEGELLARRVRRDPDHLRPDAC